MMADSNSRFYGFDSLFPSLALDVDCTFSVLKEFPTYHL